MTELYKPKHITSLATACILVNVEARVWTATKQDKETSLEVTDGKKASHDAARVTQNLLAGNKKHKAILNKRQEIYNFEQRSTYPWSGSMNLLPVVSLPKFMKEYQEHEQEFNKLKEEFLADYNQEISNMAFKMGDLFRRSNYPDVETVRGKFGINLYTSEVPQGDFRVQISEELADDLQYNYNRQARNLVESVLLKQKESLIQVMESISNCCTVENELVDGELKVKRKKIYDSTIQRALELSEVYSKFNLTDDPELEEARDKLQQLMLRVNITALRDSDSLRGTVKTEVDSILSKFKGN